MSDFSKRRAELEAFFEGMPESDKSLARDTIDEYIFFREKIEALKDLPVIVFSPSNPSKQKTTPSAKLLKEYSQVLDAKRATLIKLLKLNESDDDNPLALALKSFTQ